MKNEEKKSLKEKIIERKEKTKQWLDEHGSDAFLMVELGIVFISGIALGVGLNKNHMDKQLDALVESKDKIRFYATADPINPDYATLTIASVTRPDLVSASGKWRKNDAVELLTTAAQEIKENRSYHTGE